MHFLNILYYNYFLFYKKVIKDPEPHFATVLALSFSQSLLVNGILDAIALNGFCYKIGKWVMIGIGVLIIISNYIYYHKNGKGKEVIEEKPIMADNRSLSIAITWLFFLITASWMFWGPIYGKYLLSQCR
jgi:hypothetical protein